MRRWGLWPAILSDTRRVPDGVAAVQHARTLREDEWELPLFAPILWETFQLLIPYVGNASKSADGDGVLGLFGSSGNILLLKKTTDIDTVIQ